MLKHFTGTHDHRMDDKGRVSLPTEFRRVLDAVGSSGALYVVPQLDDARALVFFTTEAYSALIERHNRREYPSLAAQQRMELKLVTRASQIQVDDAGRIVLGKALLATGSAELQEGNDWGDVYWGVCPPLSGRGQNYLGRILMKVRAELRE